MKIYFGDYTAKQKEESKLLMKFIMYSDKDYSGMKVEDIKKEMHNNR